MGIIAKIAGTAAHCSERSEAISLQRFGISDVCRSVAKANMGGGFCIKAVTRYAVRLSKNSSQKTLLSP